jgi:integrase
MAIGRKPLAVAKAEANAANLYVQQHQPSLVDRLAGAGRTVAQLLDQMPAPANTNTAKSQRSLDKKIRAALGSKACAMVTVLDCAELVEAEAGAGRARQAEALRSRLIAVFKRAQAKGWADGNPAEITERPAVRVQRGRLTLEQFRAIHAVAGHVAEWLPHAMMLALVTGQDRSTVAAMERQHVADDHLTVWRSKTRATNQPVAIPLALRLDAVGVSLADLVGTRTGVVSRHLVHHVNPWGNAPAGSPVFPDRISKAFTAARALAGIPDEGAPTFHEIRSLAKRLYTAQGNVDTKALLGHATDRMAALYADPRGAEPVLVRVA